MTNQEGKQTRVCQLRKSQSLTLQGKDWSYGCLTCEDVHQRTMKIKRLWKRQGRSLSHFLMVRSFQYVTTNIFLLCASKKPPYFLFKRRSLWILTPGKCPALELTFWLKCLPHKLIGDGNDNLSFCASQVPALPPHLSRAQPRGLHQAAVKQQLLLYRARVPRRVERNPVTPPGRDHRWVSWYQCWDDLMLLVLVS